jgi:ribosome-associated protein
MLRITPSISIDDDELEIDFVRASGPGGQNVNKVSTAAQLRFDVARSPSLPEDVRSRLINRAGSRITNEGVLVIDAHRYRTQEQNREDALDRLATLLRQAAKRPVARKVTRPSAASRAARLKAKKRRGEVKRLRQFPHDEG